MASGPVCGAHFRGAFLVACGAAFSLCQSRPSVSFYAQAQKEREAEARARAKVRARAALANAKAVAMETAAKRKEVRRHVLICPFEALR